MDILIENLTINIHGADSAALRAMIDAALAQFGVNIMATLDDIKAAVAAQTTVIGSAITLLNELHTKLTEALQTNDTAKIQEVLDEMQAQTASLASAVQANTVG